jgi:dsRNA-specific ribonuclease
MTEAKVNEIMREAHAPTIVVNDASRYAEAFAPYRASQEFARLASLGRPLVAAAVVCHLFRATPTQAAANIEQTCAQLTAHAHASGLARALNIPAHLELPEDAAPNDALLTRALFAFVGALHSDQASSRDADELVRRFVGACWRLSALGGDALSAACQPSSAKDRLTKYFQRKYKVTPDFRVTECFLDTNNNRRSFAAEVRNVSGTLVIGQGTGCSKKEANAAAAESALAYVAHHDKTVVLAHRADHV